MTATDISYIVLVLLVVVLITLSWLFIKSKNKVVFGSGISDKFDGILDKYKFDQNAKFAKNKNGCGIYSESNKLKIDVEYGNSKNCIIYVGKNTSGTVKVNIKAQNSIVVIGSHVVLKNVDIRIKHSNNMVVIGDRTRIYENTKLVSGTGLDNNDFSPSIIIGNDCLIAEDVVIRNTDAHPIYSPDDKVLNSPTKNVCVGNHVWIGARANILKNVSVGAGSIIALGAVISKDIPEKHIARGNPMILSPLDGRYWKINYKSKIV